jgi:hypothetical protein
MHSIANSHVVNVFDITYYDCNQTTNICKWQFTNIAILKNKKFTKATLAQNKIK